MNHQASSSAVVVLAGKRLIGVRRSGPSLTKAVWCEDPKEAVRHAAHLRPRCVVLDLHRPEKLKDLVSSVRKAAGPRAIVSVVGDAPPGIADVVIPEACDLGGELSRVVRCALGEPVRSTFRVRWSLRVRFAPEGMPATEAVTEDISEEGFRVAATDPGLPRETSHAKILLPDGTAIPAIVAVLRWDVDASTGAESVIYRFRDVDERSRTALFSFLHGAMEGALRRENGADDSGNPNERYGRLLGRSRAMQRIFAMLPRVAGSDASVLIEGETGTGKTQLARAVHESSRRADSRFVVVDCAAIPPTLIESVLFGHEKGAFTGAHAARVGAFETARGGTVFLDEIGELPLEMQPKLLRVLEERRVTPIGSTHEVELDVRVIAATNRNLRDMVAAGRFRSDLYFRLDIVRLHIPPLRERREDIALFVTEYFNRLAPSADPALQDALSRSFSRQDWPGNIRELRNAVERAIVLREEPTAEEPSHSHPSSGSFVLQELFDESVSFREAKENVLERWERWYVAQLLARNAGSVSRAARAAKTDRGYLRDLIRRYGLV